MHRVMDDPPRKPRELFTWTALEGAVADRRERHQVGNHPVRVHVGPAANYGMSGVVSPGGGEREAGDLMPKEQPGTQSG